MRLIDDFPASHPVKHSKLPILAAKTPERLDLPRSHELTRRQALQKLLAGMGAALAAPALATAHPIHRHLANTATMEQANAKAAAAEWQPEFLSGNQNGILAAIAERMVPGSARAQVNRIIDLLLTVDTAANQNNLLASISALDREAEHRYRKSFPQLTPQQQDSVLANCAAASESDSQPTSTDPDDPGTEKSLVTLRDHFENLKAWIVGTYYATEAGMRELGWTEDFYFEELPACQPEGERASTGTRSEATRQPTARLQEEL
jgi:hypothetical protein